VGAAAVAASGFVGSQGTGAAAVEHHGIRFDRVLNAVEDLGMDPTGNEPIDDRLQRAVADDTLIEFPPGTYTYDSKTTGSPRNFGLRSTTGNMDDVTIQPVPEGGRFIEFRNGASHVLLEGITFDDLSEAKNNTGVTIVLVIDDELQLHDLQWVGHQAWQNSLSARVADPDGVGVIQNVHLDQKTALQDYPNSIIRASVWGDHEGTLYWRDCVIANAGSNGLYAGRNPGNVRLENCLFRNNQVSSFRIGGGGSYAKNCKVVVDLQDATYYDASDYQNASGVGIEVGYEDDGGTLVENCEFIYKNTTGGKLFEVWGNHGSATIRDCFFYNEVDGRKTFRAEKPGTGSTGVSASGSQRITIENCVFIDDGDDDDAVVDIEGRDDSTVRNCCISGTGSRPGIEFKDAGGCSVSDTNVNIGGDAIVRNDASVTTSGLTFDESCPVPSSTPSDSEPSLDRTLELAGDGTSLDSYSVTVDGEVAAVSINDNDEVDGTTARGKVYGGTDRYAFSGSITDLTVDDGVTVYVDGEVVDTDSGDDTDTGPDRTLRVEGDGSTVASYAVEVDGQLEAVSVNDNDTVGDTTASGKVYDASDEYTFSGSIVELSADDTATVYVDGEEFTAGPDRTLRVEGDGSTVAPYAVEVDGELEAMSVNDNDTVGDTTASGKVYDASDEYAFSGSIVELSAADAATVYVDGEEFTVDPDRSLRLEGDGSTVASYAVEVDGELEAVSVNDNDTVGDTRASGKVYDGSDEYAFSGSIVGLTAEEGATVYIDGERTMG
jgi:hypothetical protein